MNVCYFRFWGELTFTKTFGTVIWDRKNWPTTDQDQDPRNNYLSFISHFCHVILSTGKVKITKVAQK